MSDKEYPGNSHKSTRPAKDGETSERKKPQAVVSEGGAAQRKPSLAKRIASTFTGDSVDDVGVYILMEVIIPTAKAMFSDVVSQGIDRLLYGSDRSPRTRTANGRNYTSYSRNYKGGSSEKTTEKREISNRDRATHNFAEIIIEDRGEAEDVLENLRAIVEQYDSATVTDYYALVDITGSFTDEKYGWTDLRDARVVRVGRDGYTVNMAPPILLD